MIGFASVLVLVLLSIYAGTKRDVLPMTALSVGTDQNAMCWRLL